MATALTANRWTLAAAGVAGAAVRLGGLEVLGTGGSRTWATLLVVNVVGSALVGVVLGAVATDTISPGMATVVTLGFCGGLTTLSSVSVEVATAMRSGGVAVGVGWAVATLASCVGAVWLARQAVVTRRTRPA